MNSVLSLHSTLSNTLAASQVMGIMKSLQVAGRLPHHFYCLATDKAHT